MKILVCVDSSPLTEAVAAEAAKIAGLVGASLELVHVVTCTRLPDVAQLVPPEDMAYRVEQLEALAARLRSGGATVSTSAPLHDGAVHTFIASEATRIGARFVVVGAHTHGKAFELLVGSVTQGLIHAARVPVIVVNGLGGGTT